MTVTVRGDVSAQRPFVRGVARDHPANHPGSARPQGKSSRFGRQSGIFGVQHGFCLTFWTESEPKQSCAWEDSSYCGHLGQQGEWVQNSLLFARRGHGARCAPRVAVTVAGAVTETETGGLGGGGGAGSGVRLSPLFPDPPPLGRGGSGVPQHINFKTIAVWHKSF